MNARFLKETSRGMEAYMAEDKLLMKRMLFFTEEVTAESSNRFIQYLMCMEMDDPEAEITIFINSPGGEVVSGLAIYDTLKSISCPIRTVCIGIAASMASIIFMAGEKREMLTHTKIMIHDPLIAGMSGSHKALDLEKEAERLMKTREILGEIIAERTGRTLEEVYDKTREDYYMTAEEAVEFGIATEIIEKM